jgi:hypothetical protein
VSSEASYPVNQRQGAAIGSADLSREGTPTGDISCPSECSRTTNDIGSVSHRREDIAPAPPDASLQPQPVPGTVASATAIRRKRGPSLSRRVGQVGNVFQHSQKWDPAGKTYGRFWIDVPGSNRRRRTIALGVCRTPSIAKQKLREHIETSCVNSRRPLHQTQHRRQRFASKLSGGFAQFRRAVVSRSNPPRFRDGNTHWINGCCQILATYPSQTWAMPRYEG